jgi:hypothetical protein
MRFTRLFCFILAITCCCATCRIDKVDPGYKTKHVVIVVVDGARYSETWGDSARQYIPFRAGRLLQEGVMVSEFHNNGSTWTSAGHDAICTGNYEPLDNGGNAFPAAPSFFQYWRKATGKPSEKAWVITSKDKLYVLANTDEDSWESQFTPRYDCGVNGPYTGYRHDSLTYQKAIGIFNLHHPDLVLINFREPDYSGHSGNWNDYVNGIAITDDYVARIWNYLQNDPYYRNTTTLIVTNDHGRHLNGVSNGFVSHGDDCAGCRHVEFIAAGPDCKQGQELNVNYELTDIPTTIASLLNFPFPTGKGKFMHELLR